MYRIRCVVIAAVTCAAGLTACTAGKPAPHPMTAWTTPSVTRAAAPAPQPVQTVRNRTTAIAKPAPTPCDPNRKPRLVLVSVPMQHVWLCSGRRVAYSTAVTTGAVDLAYQATPTGTFQIQARQRNQVLTLLSGDQYRVKYWIPFDGPLFGFHDSAWQTMPYGSPQYRTRGSHGCIHMPAAAMRFLYAWAPVGTPVRIRG